MDNFKFNFLSRGQLESLILDKFLLTGFKTITYHEVFLVTKFLPLLLECCAEIILIASVDTAGRPQVRLNWVFFSFRIEKDFIL